MVATLATVGIVGAATTIGANITTAGTLNVDSGTLYVGTADRVGVGTTTPFATLSINNTAGENAFVIGSSTATWLKVDSNGLLSVAKGASFADTLAVTGAATFGNTLALTGAATFASTLELAGTASTTGSAILKSASLTSDTGAISFSNESLTTTGTLAAGNTSITGALNATLKLGVASTTPFGQLGVGAGGQATSTISVGKFCMYAGQENGVNIYIILGASQPTGHPFATTTVSCF